MSSSKMKWRHVKFENERASSRIRSRKCVRVKFRREMRSRQVRFENAFASCRAQKWVGVKLKTDLDLPGRPSGALPLSLARLAATMARKEAIARLRGSERLYGGFIGPGGHNRLLCRSGYTLLRINPGYTLLRIAVRKWRGFLTRGRGACLVRQGFATV